MCKPQVTQTSIPASQPLRDACPKARAQAHGGSAWSSDCASRRFPANPASCTVNRDTMHAGGCPATGQKSTPWDSRAQAPPPAPARYTLESPQEESGSVEPPTTLPFRAHAPHILTHTRRGNGTGAWRSVSADGIHAPTRHPHCVLTKIVLACMWTSQQEKSADWPHDGPPRNLIPRPTAGRHHFGLDEPPAAAFSLAVAPMGLHLQIRQQREAVFRHAQAYMYR